MKKDLSEGPWPYFVASLFLRKSWSWSSSFPFQKQIFRGPWPYVPEVFSWGNLGHGHRPLSYCLGMIRSGPLLARPFAFFSPALVFVLLHLSLTAGRMSVPHSMRATTSEACEPLALQNPPPPTPLQSPEAGNPENAIFSGTKNEHKPKLLSPDIFRWGRGLPRARMGAKKFGMCLETREIKLLGRDIPGFCWDILAVPEKVWEKKKVCVQLLAPIFETKKWTFWGGPHLLGPHLNNPSRVFNCPPPPLEKPCWGGGGN